MAVRPGTEDVALVAGFRKAIERSIELGDEHWSRIGQLRDRLQATLTREIPGVTINGFDPSGTAVRVPHTLNFSVPGVDRQAFLLAADMAGLAISTGSACASGSSEPLSCSGGHERDRTGCRRIHSCQPGGYHDRGRNRNCRASYPDDSKQFTAMN